MHAHQRLIDDFYKAFAARNGATMEASYATDAHFQDAVFDLHGAARIGGMWRMLCERGADLAIEHRDVNADDNSGSAYWEARYTFSATGRKVINRIHADFTFRDGKILSHRDSFSFWTWSRQALGPAGLLLGWTPLVRSKVRRTAAKNLEDFLANQR